MPGNSDLDALFTHAIAQRSGIPPEMITAEYIEEQHKKRFYPTTKYWPNRIGLKSYTLEQLEYIGKLVDELLEAV
jgi:hypothetical protein